MPSPRRHRPDSRGCRRVRRCRSPPSLSRRPRSIPAHIALRWRNIGPFRGGRTKVRGRRAEPAERVLHRDGRTAASGRPPIRPRMETGLRRAAVRLDRRDRGLDLEPERHLRGIGRGAAAPRPRDGRRHVQVHGRGSDVDAPRPARRAADPAHRDRSARIRIGCSSRCSGIRTARTPSAESSARRTAAGAFQKVLFKDDYTGGADVVLAPNDPNTVYAALWSHQYGPWENGSVQPARRAGCSRARDGGSTWKQLTNGLPGARAGTRPHPDRGEPQRAEAALRAPRPTNPAALYRSDDAGEQLVRRQHGQPDLRQDRRRGRDHGQSEERGCALRREHRRVEVGRCGEDVDRASRRARRRRLPALLDQPERPEHPDAGVGPGRGDHGERRAHVELVVQPADRGVLSRGRGQRVPVPPLQRAAGLGLGMRVEPRQRRHDRLSRVPSGGRGRVRLRRARSAQSGPRVRRRVGHSLQPPDGTGAARGPERRERTRRRRRRGHAVPPRAHRAGALLADQSAQALPRHESRVADDRRGHALEEHQSRPEPRDVGGAEERRALHRARRPRRRRGAAWCTPSRRVRWTATRSGRARTTG